MHDVISWGVGLEVEGNPPRDTGHDGEEVPALGLPLELVAEGLDEPGTVGRVAPGVEPRDCAVGNL